LPTRLQKKNIQARIHKPPGDGTSDRAGTDDGYIGLHDIVSTIRRVIIARMQPPTDDEIRFYHEHGWVVTPAIVPQELLDEAAYGAQRLYAGERDRRLLLSAGYLDWTEQDGPLLRLNDYASLQVDEIRRLVVYPLLGLWASRLMAADVVRLFHDQLIFKPGNAPATATAVGWHTDRSYWMTCTSDRMLTAWIPFQDCTEEMGSLTFLDGSHRWENMDQLREFHRQDPTTIESGLPSAEAEKIPMLLERGQVSFHHCRAVHGSRPNRSNLDRLALAVHCQDGENRYRRYTLTDGKPALHVNDVLCRRNEQGFPDYTDPDVCMVLWPPANDPA
jgi:hypothetical protein